MRFRCHGKRIDRYRVHTTVLSGGRRGDTPLYKRNDGRRQRNVPRSLQHEQNRLKNCLCRNSPKTISSNSTHFQQSSMYKTFDHLRCFSAYSFSPLCRAARFIPRLTKTQVTPRRSNSKSSFCNTVEQTNLHLRPALTPHHFFTYKKCKSTNSYAFTDLHRARVNVACRRFSLFFLENSTVREVRERARSARKLSIFCFPHHLALKVNKSPAVVIFIRVLDDEQAIMDMTVVMRTQL